MIAVVLATAASFAALALVYVPLERVFPARRGQRVLRPEFHIDALFFLGQYLCFTAISTGVLALCDRFVIARLPDGIHTFLTERPAWLQVALALMLGDLLVYWWHRACHQFDILWRFHAVHHSAEHLDWLAAHREHPLDGITTQLAMNLPALALGARLDVLAGVAVFRGLWAIFVHSNVRLPLGPLRLLLGAPELHHWHHARLDRTTHNFANLAPWLDRLFGTYHCPSHAPGEERFPLGLAPDLRGPWPRGYLAQLVMPLLPRGRRRSARASQARPT